MIITKEFFAPLQLFLTTRFGHKVDHRRLMGNKESCIVVSEGCIQATDGLRLIRITAPDSNMSTKVVNLPAYAILQLKKIFKAGIPLTVDLSTLSTEAPPETVTFVNSVSSSEVVKIDTDSICPHTDRFDKLFKENKDQPASLIDLKLLMGLLKAFAEAGCSRISFRMIEEVTKPIYISGKNDDSYFSVEALIMKQTR
jgi:hypothetical protein